MELEWSDEKQNFLHESSQTEVDVVLSSPDAVIFCECKFGERNDEKCHQPTAISKGANRDFHSCSGNYVLQVTRVKGPLAPCVLTTKGVRYWEVIPQITDYSADGEYHPCPFAGNWYQWMRNMTGVYEVAQHSGRRPAFLLVYADGPGLPIASWVKSPQWLEFHQHLRPEAITVGALSYQVLLQLAEDTVPGNPVWSELLAWVEGKITRVHGAGKKKPMTRKTQSQ